MLTELPKSYAELTVAVRRATGDAVDSCYRENAEAQGVPVEYLARHYDCNVRLQYSEDHTKVTVIAELALKPEAPNAD